jgi:hypothetical protein
MKVSRERFPVFRREEYFMRGAGGSRLVPPWRVGPRFSRPGLSSLFHAEGATIEVEIGVMDAEGA